MEKKNRKELLWVKGLNKNFNLFISGAAFATAKVIKLGLLLPLTGQAVPVA